MAIPEGGRVLLVDDEPQIRTVYERALRQQGWTVVTANDGLEAKERVCNERFDVIISDVNMPGYGGVSLLRGVHERDADVPVILLTGKPTIDSSIRAIEHGVFRYLVKPVKNDTLVETVSLAHRQGIVNRRRRSGTNLTGSAPRDVELDGLVTRAIDLLWVAFQPVISWRNRGIVGYQALPRTNEPGVETTGALLEAADRAGRLRDVGQAVRRELSRVMSQLPSEARLVVDVHGSELIDPGFHIGCGSIRAAVL